MHCLLEDMCSSLVLEDSDDPISKYYDSVICSGKFTRETVHAEPAANLLGGYHLFLIVGEGIMFTNV